MSKQSKVYLKQSAIMADRIKKLRETARTDKISQAALVDELGKKNIDVSIDSLKSYEVKENHSKEYSNYRMSVETLCGLADFFGVSTDYLLGRTEIKNANPNIKAVCELIGLSEESVELLMREKANRFSDNAHVIDCLLYDTKLQTYKDGKWPILYLIDRLFKCAGSQDNSLIRADGVNVDTTMLGPIAYSDRMIESALLVEIQRALISFKENMLEEMKNNGSY